MKYTPAPWEYYTVDGDGAPRAVIVECPSLDTSICSVDVRDNDTANAALIAAAPELLFALEQMMGWGEPTSADHVRARAAIDKAYGRNKQ